MIASSYSSNYAKAVVAATCALVFMVTAAWGQSTNTLPWYESFETLTNGFVINGTNNMYTSGEIEASVDTGNSEHGTNRCYVPNGTYFSNIIDSASTVVWADFFAQVTLRSSAPAVDSNTTAQFYFNSDGYAVVSDGPGGNWVTLSNNIASVAAGQVSTGSWTRLTVLHNYTNKTWALIVNDELLKDDIGFINTSKAVMTSMIVSNETYLDSLVIDTDYPDGSIVTNNLLLAGDEDNDGMPDYWELAYFGHTYVQAGGDDYDSDGRSSVTEYYRSTDPTNANSFDLSLAFRDGFESATIGNVSGAWRGMTNAGGVTLQTDDAIEGSKALCLTTGSVNVAVDDSTATNVWVQIYSKPQPVAGTPPDLASGQVAGFLVTTNGALLAYDATAWITCDVVSAVSTGEWMGFATHLDYKAGKYDLYVSTNATFGEHMRRAHSTNLTFKAGGGSQLTRFAITNRSEDVGYVDVIAASHAYTNTGYHSLTNLAAYDRIAGQTTSASMPPYTYPAGDDLLSGKVGTDLARELLDGDKLQIYSNGWNVYVLNSGWQHEQGAAIADLPINEAMGMQIQRGGGVDAVAFYPYSNIVEIAANIYITSVTNAVTVGWNQLSSPFSETRYPNDSPGYGFTEPYLGDRIYLGGTRLYWNGDKWKENASDAAIAMVPGEGFWYYRKGTGMWWNVSGQ